MARATAATRAVGDARYAAGEAATSPAATMLARFGYLSKGVVYIIVGGLATRVAIGDGGKVTDNKGALQAIYRQPLGQLLLWAVAIGLIGYALWSLARAVFDADHRGSDAKGLVRRVGYAAVAVTYGALALGAIRLVTGSGSAGKSSDASTSDFTAQLLRHSYGPALVTVVGLVVIGVAAILLYYAYSGDFMRAFKSMSAQTQVWVRRLGRFGIAAQAVVFTEIGIFLIVAAHQNNAKDAKGIGGALAQLSREPFGHWLLGLVAVGFVAFGLYSLAQARWRRIAGR